MRKADVFLRASGLVAIAAGLLLGVCACGSRDKSAAAGSPTVAPKSHKKQSRTAVSNPGEEALGDMVAAVSASKPGPPVELKFAMNSRPEVGQVMDLNVAVVPRAPVPDSVSVSFTVVEGLEIIEGSQLERVEKLVDGAPIRHVVRLLPKRDGIFALTAVVSFVAGNQDSTRTFSIPVIAGEGLTEQVAKGP